MWFIGRSIYYLFVHGLFSNPPSLLPILTGIIFTTIGFVCLYGIYKKKQIAYFSSICILLVFISSSASQIGTNDRTLLYSNFGVITAFYTVIFLANLKIFRDLRKINQSTWLNIGEGLFYVFCYYVFSTLFINFHKNAFLFPLVSTFLRPISYFLLLVSGLTMGILQLFHLKSGFQITKSKSAIIALDSFLFATVCMVFIFLSGIIYI